MKPSIPPITLGPIRLRLLQESDLPATLAWRNRDEVRQQFFSTDVIAWPAHLAWFARYATKPDDLVFIVETVPEHAPVGQVAIYDIDAERADAEVGRFVVAAEFAGQGLMRAALLGLQQLAIGLGLRTLRLEVKASNQRARQLYEGVGFVISEPSDDPIKMERVLPAPGPR